MERDAYRADASESPGQAANRSFRALRASSSSGAREKGGQRRNRATSSRQPAGASPARGDARVPGSTAPGVGRDPGVEAERQHLVEEAVRPTGPQHEAKPAASSLKPPRERGQGGAEPV